MKKECVLVVDDDPLVLRLVKTNLEKAGYAVLTAADGISALDAITSHLPDLIILDLMLPEMDGYEVCRRLREVSVAPVIMLTAKGEKDDKLLGFEVGTDDYLTKPFAPQELVARVRAVLRRSQQEGSSKSPAVIACGEITIDIVRRKVTVAGASVRLTKTEYQLLRELALNKGKVLSHEELLTRVWGPEYRDDRDYLWAYIRHLRLKLEKDPEHPACIISEPGYGYVLDP